MKAEVPPFRGPEVTLQVWHQFERQALDDFRESCRRQGLEETESATPSEWWSLFLSWRVARTREIVEQRGGGFAAGS